MFGERLRLQLETEGLSPSQFADSIGVNRSAISHLLNNRNNPGYDFLNKVDENFPQWDMDWLLFNRPKKKATTESKGTPKSKSTERDERRPTATENSKSRGRDYEQGDLFNGYPEVASPKNTTQTSVHKTVTKTILIYSDGTFEVYQNNFR